MKIRNKIAAVFLAMSVFSSQALVFAGMPVIAYAEESTVEASVVASESEDTSEEVIEEKTEEVVEESQETTEEQTVSEETTESETPAQEGESEEGAQDDTDSSSSDETESKEDGEVDNTNPTEQVETTDTKVGDDSETKTTTTESNLTEEDVSTTTDEDQNTDEAQTEQKESEEVIDNTTISSIQKSGGASAATAFAALQNDTLSCIDYVVADGKNDAIDIQDSANPAEQTLVEILAQNGYTVSENADQKGFETWMSQNKDVTYEITFLKAEAYYKHVVGYYEAGSGEASFVPVFRTGTDSAMTATATPVFTTGDSTTVDISAGSEIGFAIDVFTNGMNAGFFTTEKALNADGQSDHVVVYEIEDGYALGFEDLSSKAISDHDYNDVVMTVKAIACDDPEDSDDITITIKASKVVCTDPDEMPRWGNFGPDITAQTAIEYVAEHESCSLVPDWDFQWGYGPSDLSVWGVSNPGDSFIGKAPVGDNRGQWKNFDTSTDVNGVATVSIDVPADEVTSRIWVREALKENYVTFAGSTTTPSGVSAEMYCYEDVLNYDNFDFVKPLADGETYHCVAFNIPVEEGNMCLDYVTAVGDEDAITIEDSSEPSEKTLETILAENGFNNIDVQADQKGYTSWNIANGKNVTFTATLLAKEAAWSHTFGSYDAGAPATYTELLKTDGLMGASTTPVLAVGESVLFEIAENSAVGFAVDAYDHIDQSYVGRFATESDTNVDQIDHAIVFEVENGYVLAFEDITEGVGSDNDFNDVVVYVEVISCEDPTTNPTGIDLAVSKTASVATTTPNASFSYTIRITNNGPETAENVMVTDVLPSGIIFDDATTTIGSYATSTGIWTVGDMTSSTTETLTIDVTVAATTTGNIVNTATGTTTTDQTDNNPDNNTGTSTVTVINGGNGGPDTGIDLSVSKTASVATTTINTPFTYTIAVSNNGPETAEGVTVTDVLDANLTFVSATTTLGTYATSTGMWTIGDMTASQAEILEITVTASTTGTFANTATATSTGDKTDNDSDNDSDTVDVVVENGGTGGGETGIDLVLSKTASISEVSAVDVEYTYTITVGNNGPDVAEGVEVTDVLPGSVSFVSATSSVGTYATSTGIWTVGDIAPNDSETLTLVVKTVSIDGDIVNTATGTTTTDQTDNNPDNNSSTHTVTIADTNGGGGSGGSGGGGSSGGSGGGGTINVVSTPDTTYQCEYLKEFMRYGDNNNPVEVIKLQSFLNAFEGETLTVDGFFDLDTDAAVRRFQVKYFSDILEPWGHEDSTGYVYILTKKKVNEIFCQRAFPVTASEADEIVAFRAFLESLRARGVDTREFEGGIGGNPEDGTGALTDGEDDTSDIREFFRNLFGGDTEGGDANGATTTEGGLGIDTEESRFVERISNLASAALVFPGNMSDAIGCLIVLLIILAIIYILSTIIVNGMSDNRPIEIVRGRKIIAFMVGVVVAIIIALLVPYPCIIIPLLLILIALAIWWAVRRDEDKPKDMNKEFTITPDSRK